ncbi:hypothetical protein [Snodgrassella alvi]|uniref:hypothetical protein n=1 Tax=Snodgrassella alvi TaxID=1196083 RepID=UPI000C1E8F24|nr:hypothetical protein [Snodgrassella alvi]PIT17527.1 hypothetical protein BGI33_02755 [Snodgrassella alvi]PIT21748.1 hypothetical protein BGI34_00640 [Snodgrassella alvi]
MLAFLTQKNCPQGFALLGGIRYSNEALNNIANDKRFTFKYLGDFMETINFTPKELRKKMWTAALILLLLILAWRLPEMISAIKWW